MQLLFVQLGTIFQGARENHYIEVQYVEVQLFNLWLRCPNTDLTVELEFWLA